jgi:L-threonylcarbamoyladenylate synthase
VPIAAPSANRFGHVSPTTAQHVLADLRGRIDVVLDGGPTPVGVESTVLDVTRTPPAILRPGGVWREELEMAIGPVDVRGERIDVAGAQPSPGLLPTHYAPRAELIVCAGERAAALAALLDVARQAASADRRVGLLLADEDVWEVGDAPAQVATLGPRDDLTQIARNLFAAMRALDEQSLDVIVTRDFGERGVGLAIRDRLRRAASRVVE